MKNPIKIKSSIINGGILFLLFAFSISLYSCKQKDNPEKQADEQNEDKFNRQDERDAEWAVDVALANMKEIQLGQLAQRQGTSEDVKNLGKMMENDHSATLGELKELAMKKNITLPDSLPDNMQDDITDLAKKTGLDFDKEYCDEMVDAHKKNIKRFEDVANDSDDKRDMDLKNWANGKLPTLRTHLDHATKCKETVDKMDDKDNKRKDRKNDDKLK